MPDEKGRRVLGAVEYLRYDADGRLSTTRDRPRMFGQDFDGPFPPLENGMPAHYSMHVWLFKHNPNGFFEPWNPTVRCPVNSVVKPVRPAKVKPAKPAKKVRARSRPAPASDRATGRALPRRTAPAPASGHGGGLSRARRPRVRGRAARAVRPGAG